MSVNSYHKHLHKKRKKKQQEPIDRLVYLAVIFGPLMTLPQVYAIWVQQSNDVSVVSWISYLVIAVIWLFYGIRHKEKPIILVQLLWIVLDILIVAGLMR